MEHFSDPALRVLFFDPIHHIGFVHPQHLAHAATAHTGVVHLDGHFPRLGGIRVPFRFDRIIDAALLTLAALCSRSVIPGSYLIHRLAAVRTLIPNFFFFLFHSSIIS